MKPFHGKAYGSIPHLIGSNRGPADHGVNEGMHVICTANPGRGRMVYVSEKLDGSCVAVARRSNDIVPLIRSGYAASSSKYEMHVVFHRWAMQNEAMWMNLLEPGERVVGEWMAQAHSTLYDLSGHPFFAFDIIGKRGRIPNNQLFTRCYKAGVKTVPLLAFSSSGVSVEAAMKALGTSGQMNARPYAEGAVWRVENHGEFEFMAKHVRPGFTPGTLLPERTGGDPVWNWKVC
jgi:hypothetical protein